MGSSFSGAELSGVCSGSSFSGAFGAEFSKPELGSWSSGDDDFPQASKAVGSAKKFSARTKAIKVFVFFIFHNLFLRFRSVRLKMEKIKNATKTIVKAEKSKTQAVLSFKKMEKQVRNGN